MSDVMIAYPNTRPMCSANCDGAAAAVVVSGAKLQDARPRAAAPGRQGVGVGAHDRPVGGGVPGAARRQHAHPQRRHSRPTSRPASTPEDLDLVELHDCFATAELVHYDNLMLCAEGGAVDFFESGATWRDGTTPVNVSGGLQSKGHPIAATGIANIWEVCHHLRGEAGDRQIEGAKVGLAHVIGLGSACGVHILEKAAKAAGPDPAAAGRVTQPSVDATVGAGAAPAADVDAAGRARGSSARRRPGQGSSRDAGPATEAAAHGDAGR